MSPSPPRLARIPWRALKCGRMKSRRVCHRQASLRIRLSRCATHRAAHHGLLLIPGSGCPRCSRQRSRAAWAGSCIPTKSTHCDHSLVDERYGDVSPTSPILHMSEARLPRFPTTDKWMLLMVVARRLPQPRKHEECRRGCSRIRTTCRIGSKGDCYQSIALADRRDH